MVAASVVVVVVVIVVDGGSIGLYASILEKVSSNCLRVLMTL